MDKLKHNQHYSELGESFIIFICPFDRFKEGRHIYTFHETCTECPCIKLDDGATKIFLSTKGTVDDVDKDVKAFLDYVESGAVSSEFVKKLDEAVKIVKSNRKAMKEFMTYEMTLLESRQEGSIKKAEDIALKLIHRGDSIQDIHEITELTIDHIKKLAEQTPAKT